MFWRRLEVLDEISECLRVTRDDFFESARHLARVKVKSVRVETKDLRGLVEFILGEGHLSELGLREISRLDAELSGESPQGHTSLFALRAEGSSKVGIRRLRHVYKNNIQRSFCQV